jgi:outer membrane receptor protein involved in Fe transport
MTAGIGVAAAGPRARIDVGLLYGSGTPVHGAGSEHDHAEEGDHGAVAAAASPGSARVPGYFTQSLSLTVEVIPDRLELQASVENVTNRPYALAAESIFSPAQYSIPRLFSAAIRWNFGEP